jgi:hypothetical protein
MELPQAELALEPQSTETMPIREFRRREPVYCSKLDFLTAPRPVAVTSYHEKPRSSSDFTSQQRR